MSSSAIDISEAFNWEERLPHPQWELIMTWVESRCAPDAQRDAWIAVARQWLTELGSAFDRDYETFESDNFLILASKTDANGPALLQFAERCRATLLSTLSGVTNFDISSKQVVVALRTPDDYYRYLTPFYSEGEHGGSMGVHIREGYAHVALYSKHRWALENTLAHELTHVSLHHLSMPQWLEEGLAQMFEHDMTGRALLMVDSEMATEHKLYWGERGMDDFWRGEGFSRSGEVQKLSYQLAEILVRLLAEDGQPRWFGLVREPQRRFFAFLGSASTTDCGEAAAAEHLGYGLRDLAARFLGEAASPPPL
jgi:hypothetical protein